MATNYVFYRGLSVSSHQSCSMQSLDFNSRLTKYLLQQAGMTYVRVVAMER